VELVVHLAVMVAKADLMIFLVHGSGMLAEAAVVVIAPKLLVMATQVEVVATVLQHNTVTAIIHHKARLIR
jgi:hypothetical protein